MCLSVAATVLHHHVLVMPHHHLPVLVVQHGKRGQAGRHAGHTRHFVWMVKLQETLQREERDDSNICGTCCGQSVLWRKTPSYLHVCVVRWGEGLVHGCRTTPFTAIGVVPFGVDHPLAPANLLKVHPHVHPPAERILPLHLCWLTSRGGYGYFPSLLLRALVPPHPVAPQLERRHRARGPLPVQADVLGLLCCVDECRGSLAGRVLPREHHHHDPVGCRVVHAPLILAHFPLWPLCGGVLLQPAAQCLRHVEHLPGGWRHQRAGVGSQAAQKHPVLCAVTALTLGPGGVVDVHRDLESLCEGRQAEPNLGQVDVVAWRDGGHVEGDGPPPAELPAAWKRREEEGKLVRTSSTSEFQARSSRKVWWDSWLKGHFAPKTNDSNPLFYGKCDCWMYFLDMTLCIF